jgi:GNAT superfamily N-acetyltransferase
VTTEIRRADDADLGAMLELVEEYCHADEHVFDRETAGAGLRPLLAGDDRGVIWLAVVDGRIDGYAVVTWGWSIEIGGLDVVLDEIYVRTRGVGTGGRLIDALEADCRARGVKRIFMETEQPNVAARRLYTRHGFEADTSIWMSKELL